MTATDMTQTITRVGPLSELYELYLRVMRKAGHYRWFSRFMKHVGARVHRAFIRANRGRFSMSGPRLPTVLLTTKGRKAAKIERFRCTTCAMARISLPLARTSG